MKSLYITSVEPYSGKTAACLGIATHLQADGFKVGYLKPLSLQPWQINQQVTDEDAVFVKEVLNLKAALHEMAPVVLSPEFLVEHLQQGKSELMPKVISAYEAAAEGQDVVILEGGGSLREGYVVGLPTPEVARTLHAATLVVVKYRDEVRVLDDLLASQTRLGDALCGVIINRVPTEARRFITQTAVPFLEKRAIPVLGILPETHHLSALTVGELTQVLHADVLTKYQRPQALVENMMIGAMTAETALSRFRKYSRKAVITGGDRTDIQLAALETSTTCLILTGNLRPSPLVVKQAEEFGVTVLLVHANTLETVEAIERVFGKTRLGEAGKLKQYQTLLEEHFDFGRLYREMGLK